MAREIDRTTFPRLKRAVLTPLGERTRTWALAGSPNPVKLLWLRRVVLPGVGAANREFTKDIGNDLSFRGNSRDLLPAFVEVFGVWEPPLTQFLQSRLTPGRVFVDVGANLGWFALNAARWVGADGAVVAVEASPGICAALSAQIERNGLDNVRVVNEAVGSSEGWVTIRPGPSGHTGLTRVVDAGERSGEVRRRQLHQLLTDDELARCRVVKIDVEGAEYDVVRGIGPALEQLPADAELVLEVGPARAGASDEVTELFATFRAAGFHPYVMPNDYTVRAYRDPKPLRTLRRLAGLPQQETDIVFSRADVAALEV